VVVLGWLERTALFIHRALLNGNDLQCVTNKSEGFWRCTEDGRRPPGAGLQELASNRPVLLRFKRRGGERPGKRRPERALGKCRGDERKQTVR
jgi:hypothetical protein